MKFYSLVIKNVSALKIHHTRMFKEKQAKRKDNKKKKRGIKNLCIYMVPNIYHAYDTPKSGLVFLVQTQTYAHRIAANNHQCCCVVYVAHIFLSSFSSQYSSATKIQNQINSFVRSFVHRRFLL